MAKEKQINWLEVGAGLALIIIGVPFTPDEVVALPLGLGIIAHGMKVF